MGRIYVNEIRHDTPSAAATAAAGTAAENGWTFWRAGEADEHTRVWAEGMLAWQPLGDVPELMYLSAAVTPAPLLPLWKTTDAVSLNALVHEEIAGLASKKVVAVVREETTSDLPALAQVNRADPFARWWADTGVHAVVAPLPVDPWSSHPRTTRRRFVWWLVGALCVATLVVAGSSIYGSVTGRFDLRAFVRAVLEREPVATPALPPLVAPALQDTATAEVEALPLEPLRREAPVAEVVARPSQEPPPPAVATERVAPAAAPISPRVVARTAAKPKPAVQKLEPLTPQEVIAATRGQVKGLVPCIKQARVTGQLTSARYVFVLDWKIQASGNVSSAKLKAPATLVGTELAACFTAAMRKWQYRSSSEDFQVSNFPMPVTVP